tara:strand:- start:120 stop:467 length:348 start_codon:yes stop_codon:yes gene_type:complete
MFSFASLRSDRVAHDLAHTHHAHHAHHAQHAQHAQLYQPYYWQQQQQQQQRRANESSGVTTLQFVDAANGVYWNDEGMEWNVNGTHILFPLNADRAPIHLHTLYFLAGVGQEKRR